MTDLDGDPGCAALDGVAFRKGLDKTLLRSPSMLVGFSKNNPHTRAPSKLSQSMRSTLIIAIGIAFLVNQPIFDISVSWSGGTLGAVGWQYFSN
jgi:hypothetical protein